MITRPLSICLLLVSTALVWQSGSAGTGAVARADEPVNAVRYQSPELTLSSSASSTLSRAVEEYNKDAEELDSRMQERWKAAQVTPLRVLEKDLESAATAKDTDSVTHIQEAIAAVRGESADPLSILATRDEFSLTARMAVAEHYDELQRLDQEYRDSLQSIETKLRRILTRQFSLAQKREDAAQIELISSIDDQLNQPAEKQLLPAPFDRKQFTAGMFVAEYAAAPEQLSDRLAVVPQHKLGQPLAVRVAMMDRTGAWQFARDRNGFAKFHIRIEKSGEYAFTTYGFHSGSSFLEVNGVRISQAETANGSRATLLTLERGMVPVVSIGRIGNTAVRLKWKAPGDSELRPIPGDLIYYDKNLARR